MEPQPDPRKEPHVPGPNVERRIPPPNIAKRATLRNQPSNKGVAVPVYPKLPERNETLTHSSKIISSTSGLIFDACLALVSVAFCILYFSVL